MRQSEFLREKRQREFYARMLGALDKPKPNRVVAVINSAAFLWLLSALLITAGGSYFTKYQECARQADEIIDKFQRISEELHVRREAIFQAISDGGSMDAIRSSIKELPSIYFDLKPRSLPDLDEEYRKLNRRIDHSRLDDLIAHLLVNEPTVTVQQMNLFGSIARGIVQNAWPDAGLDNLKYFAGRFRVAFQRGYLAVRYTEFSPSCRPGTVARLMFSTSKPPVVQGIPYPLYVNVPVPMP